MRFWPWHRHDHDGLLCREFVEAVTAYVEGVMPAAERARLEAHLADCEGCSGYLEDMRRLVGSLHAAVEPPPDPETRDALLRAFRELRAG
jgi:anti-sigma factor RsiW